MEVITNHKERQYESIPTNNGDGGLGQPIVPKRSSTKIWTKKLLLVSTALGFVIAVYLTKKSSKTTKHGNLIMPSGVNLGSWLSLEDYFFAGKGSVEVATPTHSTAGTCLPPLHVGPSTGPRWNSETDLLYNLWKSTSLAHALRTFHAHRTSFVDLEEDLKRLKDLGIGSVRVPMSWCLTDADPSLLTDDAEERDLLELFTCRDPFFEEEVYWPAVPKSVLRHFLKRCAFYGVKAVLDIHTYPGATSIGTFNGVWPRWPRFWTHGDLQQPDVGRSTLQSILTWVESLHQSDPEAFRGIRAISIMNEPAHLLGLFNGPKPTVVDSAQPPFVPPLPEELARPFLEQINTGSPSKTVMPDGEHLRVFLWLRDGIDAFRKSTLPALGIECHVNTIETIFASALIKGEATPYIASFWRTVTTPKERKTWAIMDIHRYHAWDPQCQGTTDGIFGNYTCSDIEARDQTLKKCTEWASHFRTIFDRECGKGARLTSAEFSSSTHHSVRHACQDVSTLKATYHAQTETAAAANIELFYWAYQMPYGGAFRNAWSFKQLMYLTGVWDKPDERLYDCGEHVAAQSEPHDLSFGN